MKYLCSDPSGVRIYLVDDIPDIHFSPPFSMLGNFAGVSLETTDMDRSMTYYQAIGFTNRWK